MTFTAKDIKQIMEGLAPVNLKESYDKVGLMVGSMENEVTNILIALDCTFDVINEAKEKNCNLIITHHPLLFNTPETITEETLIGRKVIELIRNNITLYSSHTNLDSVKGGLNDIITELLGFHNWSVIEPNITNNSIEEDGIGRIVTLKSPVSLMDICIKVKAKLELSNLRYVGEPLKQIKNIAIINGSGEDFYNAVRNCGADLIITGDTKYHNTSDYHEMGLCVIDAGHFETEWPAMKIFANIIKTRLRSLGYDKSIITSQSCKPIYNYL